MCANHQVDGNEGHGCTHLGVARRKLIAQVQLWNFFFCFLFFPWWMDLVLDKP